jgi:hypothetical protein
VMSRRECLSKAMAIPLPGLSVQQGTAYLKAHYPDEFGIAWGSHTPNERATMTNRFIAAGNQVYDAQRHLLGTIEPDGRVVDASFHYRGKFEGNRFYDAGFNYVGEIREDGAIVDATFHVVGWIRNDGVILASDRMTPRGKIGQW